jgi:16S rRNA processing protein RimM
LSTDEELVFIGTVARAHGVRGELKLVEGEGASGAWRESNELFIGANAQAASRYAVRQVRGGGRFVIVALEGVDDRDKAEVLRQLKVFVPRNRLPSTKEGEYYIADLLGLEVVDEAGRVYGVVHEIFDNGAHDVYVVRKGKTEILIPAVEGVVLEVDTQGGRLVMDVPEGL